MATNVLAIPQPAAPLNIRTQANVSWIDAFGIVIAGQAAGLPSPGNTGSGTITITGLAPITALGVHTLVVTDVSGAEVVVLARDPSGAPTGIGVAGQLMAAGGLTFALTASTPPLAVGDAFTITVAPAPLDISGIELDLMIRTSPGDPAVALWATTRTVDGAVGRIVSGGAGGQVALDVPETVMARLRPGTYVYDIVASADERRVLVAYGTIEHVRGVATPTI